MRVFGSSKLRAVLCCVEKWTLLHKKDGLASRPGGVAVLLVATSYRNRDKLRLSGPPWPECSFILILL